MRVLRFSMILSKFFSRFIGDVYWDVEGLNGDLDRILLFLCGDQCGFYQNRICHLVVAYFGIIDTYILDHL